MKRLAIIIISFATLGFVSCGILGNVGNNTVAQATGQTCGKAILSLYSSYKSTGTINLTNPTNLTNAITLAACYTQIKANKGNSAYRKAFSNGLIMSSSGLITNQNVNNVINTLLMVNSLGNLNSSTASNSTTTQNASAGITTLMKTL